MQEDYVQLPSPTKQQSADSAEGGGAVGPLPDGYPAPLSRVIVRNFRVLITLNQAEDQKPPSGTCCLFRLLSGFGIKNWSEM